MRKALQKINDGICKVSGCIIALIILGLIVLNFTQLVTRYFVSVTFTWAEEVSVLSLIYAAAIGAPWVTLKRAHLKMDAADKLIPLPLKKVAYWVQHLLIFTTGVIFIVAGCITVDRNQGYVLSILGFDEAIRYIPIVLEGVLLVVAEIITFLEDILDLKAGKLVIE